MDLLPVELPPRVLSILQRLIAIKSPLVLLQLVILVTVASGCDGLPVYNVVRKPGLNPRSIFSRGFRLLATFAPSLFT